MQGEPGGQPGKSGKYGESSREERPVSKERENEDKRIDRQGCCLRPASFPGSERTPASGIGKNSCIWVHERPPHLPSKLLSQCDLNGFYFITPTVPY